MQLHTRGRSKNCPCHAITLVAHHCLMSRVQFKLTTLCMSKLPSVVSQPCMMYRCISKCQCHVMQMGKMSCSCQLSLNLAWCLKCNSSWQLLCTWANCPVSCLSTLHGIYIALQAVNFMHMSKPPCQLSLNFDWSTKAQFKLSMWCNWAKLPWRLSLNLAWCRKCNSS